jgi:peptidyl-prolyl cis-trans isomerase D
MSILEKMRGGSESTLMQLVLAAVVVSFVMWYGQPQGNQGTVVATVNGKVIPDTDFLRQYVQYENMREYRLGRPLTEAEQTALRDEVKGYVVRDEVLRQQAAAYGLEVSDDEVARAVISDPRFANDQGLFDEQIYTNALKRMRYSRADYEANLRDSLLRDKLRALVFQAPTITDTALKQAYVDQATSIDLAYVRVSPARFHDEVDTSSEAVKTFLAENGDRVKAAYDADFERLYNVPEKVRLRMIRLEVKQDGVTPEQLTARLADLKTQIAGGADMAQLAARFSEDPSAAQGGLLDETPIAALDGGVVDAIAKLEAGALSEVVADPGQVRLYKLEERVPARVIPQEEVQNDIAMRLMREQEGPKLAAAYAEKLLAAWTEAKEAPADLLLQQELQVQQTGPMPLGQEPSPMGPPADMIKEAASLKAGDVLPKVYEANGNYWVGELDVREEPDMARFDEQKAVMKEVVLTQLRSSFFEGWVDDVVKSAKVE